jgi:hypothetical protein
VIIGRGIEAEKRGGEKGRGEERLPLILQVRLVAYQNDGEVILVLDTQHVVVDLPCFLK